MSEDIKELLRLLERALPFVEDSGHLPELVAEMKTAIAKARGDSHG